MGIFRKGNSSTKKSGDSRLQLESLDLTKSLNPFGRIMAVLSFYAWLATTNCDTEKRKPVTLEQIKKCRENGELVIVHMTEEEEEGLHQIFLLWDDGNYTDVDLLTSDTLSEVKFTLGRIVTDRRRGRELYNDFLADLRPDQLEDFNKCVKELLWLFFGIDFDQPDAVKKLRECAKNPSGSVGQSSATTQSPQSSTASSLVVPETLPDDSGTKVGKVYLVNLTGMLQVFAENLRLAAGDPKPNEEILNQVVENCWAIFGSAWFASNGNQSDPKARLTTILTYLTRATGMEPEDIVGVFNDFSRKLSKGKKQSNNPDSGKQGGNNNGTQNQNTGDGGNNGTSNQGGQDVKNGNKNNAGNSQKPADGKANFAEEDDPLIKTTPYCPKSGFSNDPELSAGNPVQPEQLRAAVDAVNTSIGEVTDGMKNAVKRRQKLYTAKYILDTAVDELRKGNVVGIKGINHQLLKHEVHALLVRTDNGDQEDADGKKYTKLFFGEWTS